MDYLFFIKVNIESERNEYEQLKKRMTEFYHNHVIKKTL